MQEESVLGNQMRLTGAVSTKRQRCLLLALAAIGMGELATAQAAPQDSQVPLYGTLGFQDSSAVEPRPLGPVAPSRIVARYELIPVRLLIERPVTREEIVTETEFRNREVIKTRPVWEDETRYRVVERRTPVERERTLVQTKTVEKPVLETAYEERTYTETVMKEVVETESRQQLVRRPVTRTGFRDETVLVAKPVERTVLQPEDVTTYRPVLQSQTVYSPTLVPLPQTAPAASTAPSLQWRNRGYVSDATTGQQVWQRGGLHWVRPTDGSAACPPATTAYIPAYVPQQQMTTAYVPEVTQQFKPVTVTETSHQYETRRVPYSMEAIEETVETQQVPVTRMKPTLETRVSRVPVERLRYEQQTITEEIPIRETVYETTREQEPYTVQVRKEVSETSYEQVPVQVQRVVTRESNEQLVRDVLVRVPVDENGDRSAVIPRELRVQLHPVTDRVPADRTTLDYDQLRLWVQRGEEARAMGVDSGNSGGSESGIPSNTVTSQKVVMSDFAPVRPDPARDEGAIKGTKAEQSVMEKTPLQSPSPAEASFQRGVSPEAPGGNQNQPTGPSDRT